MKAMTDKHRIERHFQIEDWVNLKLKTYRQYSLHKSKLWKLSPKFVGPFQVIEKIGAVAYKLQLPGTAKIHSVFHFSLLKKQIGANDRFTSVLPQFDDDGKVILQPLAILAHGLV